MRVLVLLLTLLLDAVTANAFIRSDTAVLIGGIKQWISIRGVDDRKPVLLFLHGGPGNSAMSQGDKFTLELQKEFVVVFWDQRETGKTKSLNESPLPLTVSVFEQDAVSLITYLKQRFHQERIFLMGLSWGGFLGLMVSWHHPKLLRAYFAISPMIHQLESEQLSLSWMKAEALREGNKQKQARLNEVRIPFQSGEQLYEHRRWLALAMGQTPASKSFVVRWSTVWLKLFNEASKINFQIEAPEIGCPIFFFVGRNDFQTHFKLAQEYFAMVKAPQKELFWFDHSGHVVNLSEPAKLQDIIIHRILPALRH